MTTETALRDIPAADDHEGITYRGFRGVDADLPGMAEANQAARRADGGIQRLDLDEMRNVYTHLERTDPATDILIAEDESRIVGYARVEWDDTNDGERIYDAIILVHPEVRAVGVQRAFLTWSERRRRAIAAGHAAAGEAPDRPRFLTAFVNDDDEAMNVLVRAAGYEVFRRFHEMVRPDFEAIAMPPLPDGLELRPVDRDEATMRRIFDAQNEAFRDGFGWVDESATAFAAFCAQPNKDPALWQVAFDGEEVAGAVLPALEIGMDGAVEGWLDPVFTRRAWRRRGLARALVARSLVVLREQGCVRACLGVDAMNPNQALDLYESSGFSVVSATTGYRRPLVDPGGAVVGVA